MEGGCAGAPRESADGGIVGDGVSSTSMNVYYSGYVCVPCSLGSCSLQSGLWNLHPSSSTNKVYDEMILTDIRMFH